MEQEWTEQTVNVMNTRERRRYCLIQATTSLEKIHPVPQAPAPSHLSLLVHALSCSIHTCSVCWGCVCGGGGSMQHQNSCLPVTVGELCLRKRDEKEVVTAKSERKHSSQRGKKQHLHTSVQTSRVSVCGVKTFVGTSLISYVLAQRVRMHVDTG